MQPNKMKAVGKYSPTIFYYVTTFKIDPWENTNNMQVLLEQCLKAFYLKIYSTHITYSWCVLHL